LTTEQGEHGRVLDPKFEDLSNNKFRLGDDSVAIDSGGIIDSPIWWRVPIIQGKDYSEEVKLSVALHPNTDWTTVIPTVITADQNDHGDGWERGAYVYIDSKTCAEQDGVECSIGDYCLGGSELSADDVEVCCSRGSVCTVKTCEGQGYELCDECLGEEYLGLSVGELKCCDGCDNYISKDGWSLVGVSSEAVDYLVANVFDDDVSTFWHTAWVDPVPVQTMS